VIPSLDSLLLRSCPSRAPTFSSIIEPPASTRMSATMGGALGLYWTTVSPVALASSLPEARKLRFEKRLSVEAGTLGASLSRLQGAEEHADRDRSYYRSPLDEPQTPNLSPPSHLSSSSRSQRVRLLLHPSQVALLLLPSSHSTFDPSLAPSSTPPPSSLLRLLRFNRRRSERRDDSERFPSGKSRGSEVVLLAASRDDAEVGDARQSEAIEG
jgi:hypothetical protein